MEQTSDNRNAPENKHPEPTTPLDESSDNFSRLSPEEQWNIIRAESIRHVDDFVQNYVYKFGIPTALGIVGVSAMGGFFLTLKMQGMSRADISERAVLVGIRALAGATAITGVASIATIFAVRKFFGINSWIELNDRLRERINPLSRKLGEKVNPISRSLNENFPKFSVKGVDEMARTPVDDIKIMESLNILWKDIEKELNAPAQSDTTPKPEVPKKPRLDDKEWGILEPLRIRWKAFKEKVRVDKPKE